MEIKDKVAIVTGASSGIGLATARLLAKGGTKVAFVSRSIPKLKKISKKLQNSFVFSADMTQEKDIKKMISGVYKHFGRIDILINSAGQGYDASLEYTNTKIFRKIFELDVLGPLVAMQTVVPIMRKQGKGVIVNVSSGTSLMYLPNMGAYSGAKRVLNSLSLTSRVELKKDNISVVVVYPYITLTDFEKNTIKDSRVKYDYEGGGNLRPPDTAEYVAEKILGGIKSEEAEIFVHEWMKKLH